MVAGFCLGPTKPCFTSLSSPLTLNSYSTVYIFIFSCHLCAKDEAAAGEAAPWKKRRVRGAAGTAAAPAPVVVPGSGTVFTLP